jgi:Protein of unknown function (DUF2851)
MQNNYSKLLSPCHSSVSEKQGSYLFFTERHLQAIWLEQKYFTELKTADGEVIQIISPGIWNQNAGPDFLKAHLFLNKKEIRGDIEIHLSANDWYHHHHHQDSRYAEVVLHVVLWNPKSLHPILTKDSVAIPQVFMENFLTISPARLVHTIDLDLYPYKKFVGSGKCAQLLFQRLPEHTIIDFFRSASAWRLTQKMNYLQARVEDPALYFSVGMAMALGYKNNTEVFFQLFSQLYPRKNLGEEALFALALGACGLFDPQHQTKWEKVDYYQHLHALYLMLALNHRIPSNLNLNSHQVRPFNHPVRRLAALTKLITDDSASQIYPKLLHKWSSEWKSTKRWRTMKEELKEMIPIYRDVYWSSRYLFENTPQHEQLPLLGSNIKQEVMINTFLPLLYCDLSKRGDPDEVAAFHKFYMCFSASFTGKTHYLIHRFFGETPKAQLVRQADIEQGAFQLHRDFCLHFEASCEGCPFIERFNLLEHRHDG